MLELKLIEFNNNQGVCKNSVIPKSMRTKRDKQILDKWTINDIQFINYNIKCILELQKIKKSDYKTQLIENYRNTIEEYTDIINSKK